MKKIAIITGASSGIGREVAKNLSMEYHLILCGRNMSELEKTALDFNTSKNSWEYINLDLNDSKSINEASEIIYKNHKSISLLFNNAGVSQRSLASETSIEVEKKLMQVNYFGPVLFTKLLLPLLRNGSGRIAVTSSIVGKFGFPLRSTYSAAKHALHGFFESLRFEEAKNGIFVQLFVIGRAQTQVSVNAMTESGVKHGKMDRGQLEGISAEHCSKRIIKAIKTNKKEVLIGGREIWMVLFKKYIPFLFYRIAEKENNNV